ncbi:MAG TPA: sugar phosphate isomerase/epimerase family protein [Pirellulaceae bacterium]|nr:sugar phosphate isomerase/epimerase family protein [Pirellulaceae bacterium]
MKFAICNETYVDWPLDRAFASARQCGYTGIEIAPFTLASSATEVSAAQRAEIRRQAEAADIEVIGLHWLLAKTTGYYLTTPDSAVRRATAAYLGELARLCRDLGGELMVLGSPVQRNLLPGVTHEEATKYAADVLLQALPIFEECDVTLAVEPLGPLEGDFLNTADLGAELCNLVGSRHCRLHLDVKAMSTETKPIPQIIHEQQRLLHHFHANDPNRLGPGMGEIDFVPIFQALGEIDYRGWISVEVFDYSPGAENIARISMENMLTAVAQLGE